MAGLLGGLQAPISNGLQRTGPGAPTKGGGDKGRATRLLPHHPPGSQNGKGNPPGGQKGKANPHKGAASGGRGRPTQGGRFYPHAQPLSGLAGSDAYCFSACSQTGSAQERKTPAPPTCLSVCKFGTATPRSGHEAPSREQGPPSGRPQGSSAGKGKGSEWSVVERRWWPATSKGVDLANPPCGYGPGGQPQLNLQAREGRHYHPWSALQSNNRRSSNFEYRNGLKGEALQSNNRRSSNFEYRNGLKGGYV